MENGGSITNFDEIANIKGINEKTVDNLRQFCASQIANDTHILENQLTFQQAESMPRPDYFPNNTFSNDFVEHVNNFMTYDESMPPVDLTEQNGDRIYKKASTGKAIRLVLEPKLNKFTSIQSFTSIYQEADGIAIARFSANGWTNEVKIDAWTHYKTATFGVRNLYQICEQLTVIVDQLPPSDIYIIDDHIKAQYFRKSVTSKKLNEIVQVNQQCAILVALLHKKRISNKNDGPNIFFMGYGAVGQLFNLLVGKEPISTQSTIKSILRGDFCSDTVEPFNIDVSEEIKRAYHKTYPVERECLGRSMLIGLTFIRLKILK